MQFFCSLRLSSSRLPFCTSARANGCARSELMNIANAILLVVCALVCGYLLYALLKPEDF